MLILVRLAGIEPTTPWFVAKYSIQLSYSRVKREYSTPDRYLGSPYEPEIGALLPKKYEFGRNARHWRAAPVILSVL